MCIGLLPPGETPLLGNIAVTPELGLRGAFPFDSEVDDTIDLPGARCCPSTRS
ncbi:hypothetical protein [Streptomyces europaeiscabiei]|uniref:Uncharacterized protein n=1 Tax=Streptomyces europaeiscabiei TaxID=146819 RepID=A0ABU4NSV4_9ACTN|nr:hypothetical protein [Streptomyces europaeiscabiei]MDX3548548.1 hypothetical protein [Streptomyces europaeiscabiei]MDX3558192.1 hypothetical protein [Streptomyces europaeiscabiei]MDX3706021.1 hypothetical protein [Streptomyces europaeiscabiei]MDX3710249.1 hypothetical protein [Streptomyces europaeiscabiei]MDX3833316.1 hypothetical protein [Streptomyces europaeiscabiei]